MFKRFFLTFILFFIGACSPTASASPADQIAAGIQFYNPMLQAAWSGVVIDEVASPYGYEVMALTIIHDEPSARALIPIGAFPMIGNIGADSEAHSFRVVKWDPCSEVALVSTVINRPTIASPLAWFSARAGARVTTVGNPLGHGLEYNEGHVGANGTTSYSCSFAGKPVALDSYGSGVVPGQTGSAVYRHGGIVGLITAVALYPVEVVNQNGETIGETAVPVSNLGMFVPLSIIKRVLRYSPFL